MKNGKCPTWFVVKWLEKHATHTALAPETSDAWESMANTTGYTVAFWTKTNAGWERCAPFRNDWTIYRADGKPVSFKRKRRQWRTGEGIPVLRGDRVYTLSKGKLVFSCVAQADGDVLIRERKS